MAAEQKTAKILAVKENTRTFGKDKTYYVHEILFEGAAQKYNFNSLNPKCTEFVEDQVATFTFETTVNGQFTNHIIRPVGTNTGGGSGGGGKKGGGGGKSPEQENLITLQSVFSSICNLHQGSNPKGVSETSILMKTIVTDTEKVYDWMRKKAKKGLEATTPPAAQSQQPAAQPAAKPAAPATPAAPVTQQPAANPLDQFQNNEEDDDLPF